MPDPYSDGEKSSAPSRQHLRGASVTQAVARGGIVDRGAVLCAEFKATLAQEFSITSPVRFGGPSDCARP